MQIKLLLLIIIDENVAYKNSYDLGKTHDNFT